MPTDLLGDKLASAKRVNSKPEASALIEVLMALRAHPAVAWVERQNSGATRMGNRFVKFGWPGCSDVLGQLHDGRFLAVEVKAATGRLSAEQIEFLARVNQSGGLGFVARNCADVFRKLNLFSSDAASRHL